MRFERGARPKTMRNLGETRTANDPEYAGRQLALARHRVARQEAAEMNEGDAL